MPLQRTPSPGRTALTHAAPEDNVREDDAVSGVVAVSDDDDIVDVVDCAIVDEVVLIRLEVVRLITCR